MTAYYVASCMFSAKYPALSVKVQDYMRAQPGVKLIRCCIPDSPVQFNEDRIPDEAARGVWKGLPVYEPIEKGDTILSICHNCTNIAEESWGARAVSIWEYIDADPHFVFPDHSGMTVTVQDCWRTRERADEQAAVRSLLRKMNIAFVEAERNHEQTDFCGCTLYRKQPDKNPRYAPRHYRDEAEGKFLPHTPEEIKALMTDYCRRFTTDTVVCYCHYCIEGLLLGGAHALHLAELLFA